MWLDIKIANRLSTGAGKEGKSPAHNVAIIAVALSVAVMLISVAIVAGFKEEIKKRISGFNPDVTIYAMPSSYAEEENSNGAIILNKELEHFLASQSNISDYQLVTTVPVLLKSTDAFKGMYMKGIDSDYNLSLLEENLVAGSLPDYSDSQQLSTIILSQIAADKLSLNPGDTINTYYMGESIRVRPLRVGAIFNSHFDVYDEAYLYSSSSVARELTGLKRNEGSMIEIRFTDSDDLSGDIYQFGNALEKASLTGVLPQFYQRTSVLEQGANYFSWLELLDTNVVVILTLMTVVAAFTLISAMLIIILERLRFIGIMKALGSSTFLIRKIFIWMALRVGGIGLIAGNIFALGLLLLQKYFHIIPLDSSAYYMDYVPVSISVSSIIIIDAAFALVIYLVLILPSHAVANISPSESMRYE